MKKVLGVLLITLFVFSLVSSTSLAAEPIRVGKADYAAHGDKAFAVAFAVLQGDQIVGAFIDEYQFLPRAEAIGVPNSDATENGGFGSNYANPETAMASKRLNNEYYSQNMKRAGSTVSITDNFIAIEDYVVGKTVAELEAILAENDDAAMVDAVTSATLVDTKGYIEAILAAAKAAQ